MKFLRAAVITTMAVLMFCPSVHARFDGSFNMNFARTDSYENGVRMLRSDRFSQNYYLGLSHSINPMFSYRLFLRANLTDISTTSGGVKSKQYNRTFEPTLDLYLRNHVYSVSAGYRRSENWKGPRLTNDVRYTTEYLYSRANLTPWELPTLSLEADRRMSYNYLSPKGKTTENRYSVGSFYRYKYKTLNTRYNITYTYTDRRDTIGIISRSISDSFSGLFNISYSKPLFGDKVNIATRYQANYGRSSTKRYVTQTGSVLFERVPFQGLYAAGTAPLPPGNTPTLGTQNALIDDDTATGVGGIDIATGLYHNVGLQVLSSAQAVDSLYVYVKADGDVSTDTALSLVSNWRVYTSPDNLVWTQVTPISSVTIVTVDAINNVYRYELTFAAQNAAFYKVINQATVSAIGVTSAQVSEVETLGTDIVPSTGILSSASTNFTQGWNFNVSTRPAENLDVSFNYYINQADQNSPSVLDSFEGLLENIVSKARRTDAGLRSLVSRSYGPSVTWRVHRLLTTSVVIGRSETFDNLGTTDSSSNSYSLNFHYIPIKNIDASFSFIRSDGFSFGNRTATTDTYLLTVGSRLYREVNMVLDVGHTETENHQTDEVTKSSFMRGSIDARITKQLFTNLSYGITRNSEPTSSTIAQVASVVISYRVGRLMNISGNFRFSDDIQGTTTSEGVSIDWLPIRVIRLNLSYSHQRSPGPITSDSIASFVRWNIKRFLDMQLTYTYSRSIQNSTESENRSISMTLSGRFN